MNQLGVVEMIKVLISFKGIYSIPLALKKLCLELGVKIKMNCKVENINYRKKFSIEPKMKQ